MAVASQDPRIAFMMRALDLPSHAYKLAALLAWRYGSKGGSIFPSQATLARDLQTSPKTVQRMLRRLESIGLETEIRHGPDGKNNQSSYRFGGIVPDTTDLNSPIVPDTHVRNPASSGHLGPELRTFETRVADTTDPVTNRITKRVTKRVTKRGRDSNTPEFDAWWNQYPRKVSIGAARKAYALALKKGASPADLLNGATRYAREREQQDPRYTKHPATWLNSECWKDEPQRQQGRPIGRSSMVANLLRGFDDE